MPRRSPLAQHPPHIHTPVTDGHDAKAQPSCLKLGDYGSVHAPEPFCAHPWELAEAKSTKPHCHPAVSLLPFQLVLGALSQQITCLNSLPPTTPGSTFSEPDQEIPQPHRRHITPLTQRPVTIPSLLAEPMPASSPRDRSLHRGTWKFS